MKRIAYFLLAIVMLLSLCACAAPDSADSTTGTTGTTGTTEATEAPREDLQKLLTGRQVPQLKTRDEMLDILQKEVYGYMPPEPTELTFETDYDVVSTYAAGKAKIREVTVNCKVNGKPFSFKFRGVIPNGTGKFPFVIHIGMALGEHRYQPNEEIVDNGYAVFNFNYTSIATDDKDFTTGLAACLYENGQRGDTDAGKIAMWAWAASRVMDYCVQELDHKLDLNRGGVAGHSRCGKAALLAGAMDTRFQYVYSNDSGSTGAAISRLKTGEDVKRITSLFPYWFCKNYKQYAQKETEMPFDQHYLLASIAPRHVLVGSASSDSNADPVSEQLGCLAASPAFQNGFVCDGVARVGDEFFEGDIGYHLRKGAHYFSREDWQKLIKFVNYKSSQTK